MFSNDFDIDTISDDLAILLESVVVGLVELGETELSGDEDLLTSWELELGSSQGFLSVGDVISVDSDGQEDLSDTDSGTLAETLSESTSHSLLESICTSAGKHLVDSNDVPWVDSDSHVEVLSTNVGGHVLVASNSGGLESFRSDLLLFVTNQMDACWEVVVSGSLLTDIVDSQLWVWDTSVESGLWIWLIFLVSVAPRWSSTHFNLFKKLN